MAELSQTTTPAEADYVAAQALGIDRSAVEILDRRQRRFLAGLFVVVVACLLIAPLPTLITIMTLVTIAYLATVTHRIVITRRSLRDFNVVRVSDEDARAVPAHQLPRYTVFVPAYHEAGVIPTLVAHLRALEYPRDRLDLKLLLEVDDEETITAAREVAPDIEIVLIPPGGPRTKPRALNCGLTVARGEYVTIYDAEDVPDPLQLRRAVVAFQRLPPDVACLQAQLTFFSWDRNIITRWFAIEYLMWFTMFLPGLSSMDAPVPLGGTSNHMRRDVLETIGAWDAFNVTEDADLGLRLHARGWRTAVLESETYEEPNSDFVNWMKQRSRWYKGYLQTWLVNLRRPIQLWRELGTGGFAQFNLFVGGTPLLALLNPIFWLLTFIWFAGKATVIQQVFPAPLYHVALFCWVVGNVSVLYVTILAARRSGENNLVWAACLVPVYWVMMSMAAIKAGWQVLAAPSYWEKTTHGLTEAHPAALPVTVSAMPIAAPTVVPTGGFLPPPAPPLYDPIEWSAPDPLPDGEVWGERPGVPPAPVLAATPLSPRARAALGAGQTVRTVGALVVLFVAFLVLGTGWKAHGSQHTLRQQLSITPAWHVPQTGDPLATLAAPSIGLNVVVVEGAGPAQLAQAPGHVPGSAVPGEPGNAVIVGHRTIAAGPFSHLGQLERGDTLEVDAPWGTARYRVDRIATGANLPVDFAIRGPGRLTLVTGGSATSLDQKVMVTAHLVARPLRRAPARQRVTPQLPATDPGDYVLLGAALLAGLLAWYGRRWFVPLWGRTRAAVVAAPFAIVALYEVFQLAVRLLPPTF